MAFISDKYPSLSSVYGTADSLKLYLEASVDGSVQNMFYNGWKSDHFVGVVLLFVPSGRIASVIFNAPGGMHGSQISEWGAFYDKIENLLEKTGGTIVVDSAFDKGRYGFLIKSAQDKTHAETQEDVNTIRQATSLRQSTECGMRMF